MHKCNLNNNLSVMEPVTSGINTVKKKNQQTNRKKKKKKKTTFTGSCHAQEKYPS